MLDGISLWGMSGATLIVFLIGVYYLAQAYTSVRLPILGDIISKKNTARNLGALMVIGALLFSGALGISVGQLGAQDVEDEAVDDIIETRAESTTHVSTIEDSNNFIQVQYETDGENITFAEDDSDLDNVVFDLIAERIDFSTGENDRTIVWSFDRQDTWDNDGETWEILDEDSNNDPTIYFDGNQGSKGVQVDPARSGSVEVDMDIATGWGDEIETYSSKSVYVSVEDAASGQAETWEIEFLRTA